jgi:hypothetical protein
VGVGEGGGLKLNVRRLKGGGEGGFLRP